MLLASLKEANDDDDHIPLTILLFKGPPLAKPTIVTKLWCTPADAKHCNVLMVAVCVSVAIST